MSRALLLHSPAGRAQGPYWYCLHRVPVALLPLSCRYCARTPPESTVCSTPSSPVTRRKPRASSPSVTPVYPPSSSPLTHFPRTQLEDAANLSNRTVSVEAPPNSAS